MSNLFGHTVRVPRLSLPALVSLFMLAGGAWADESYYGQRYKGQEIAEIFGCLGYCHVASGSKDSLTGPPFAAIAEKYKGNEGAPLMMLNNVLQGSKNVWGSHEMLPQSYIAEPDLKIVIDWIFSQ